MAKRKTTTKAQVIAALKKWATVPEIVKQCGISKAHARSIIYGLGRKVRRQSVPDAAFTAYRLKK